jgi:hypothetical protein
VGQQGLVEKHGNGGSSDWDESSEDNADGPSPPYKVSHVSSSGADVRSTAAPGVCNAGLATAVVKGVKADNNWLDDDFDS